MTSELQERIAKAICDFDCEGTGLSWANSPWEERPEWVRENCMSVALVAMKAARETTAIMSDIGEQMLDAGAEVLAIYGAMLGAEIAAAEGGDHD